MCARAYVCVCVRVLLRASTVKEINSVDAATCQDRKKSTTIFTSTMTRGERRRGENSRAATHRGAAEFNNVSRRCKKHTKKSSEKFPLNTYEHKIKPTIKRSLKAKLANIFFFFYPSCQKRSKAGFQKVHGERKIE